MKYNIMKTQKIGVNTLMEKINGLGRAEPVKVVDEKGRPVTNAKAMWCEKFKMHVGVVSNSHYKLIQHQEAFLPLAESVALMTDEVHASVSDQARRAYMNIALPQMSFKASDGEDISIGFTAINSYNGTTAVSIIGYGFRMVCSNGMVLPTIMGSARIVHMGKAKEKLTEFVKELETKMVTLVETIKQREQERVLEEQASEWLEEKYGPRTSKHIMDIWSAEQSKNIWTLYNAITNYFSHKENLSPMVQHKRLATAEELLAKGIEPVLEVIRSRKK